MKTRILRAAIVMVCLLAQMTFAQNVGTYSASGLREPYGIAMDANFNIYIADSGNNRIVKISGDTQIATILAGSGAAGSSDGIFYAASFNDPHGLMSVTISNTPGLLVADYGNHLIRFVRISDGFVTTIAGQTNGGPASNASGTNATFRYPIGMAQDTNGNVYIADWGNNAIRVMNLGDPVFGVTNLSVFGATFPHPAALTFDDSGQLWVADSDGSARTTDNTVKLITLYTAVTGSLKAFVGGNSVYTAGGYKDDPAGGTNVLFNSPHGLLWDKSDGLLVADSINNVIRLATNNTVYGLTNYSVLTYAGSGLAGSADGTAATAQFNSPCSLVKDTQNGRYLVTDLKNNSIRIIQYGPVLGRCLPPTIGYISIEIDPVTGPYLKLNPVQNYTFNNDGMIGIGWPKGTLCAGAVSTNETPKTPVKGTNDFSIVNFNDYSTDIAQINTVNLLNKGLTITPVVNVSGFCYNPGQQNSVQTNAVFRFETASPALLGKNANSFQVLDLTIGSTLYYTTDGTLPTNSSASAVFTIGQDGNNEVTLDLHTNFANGDSFLFRYFALKQGYKPSLVQSYTFQSSDIIPDFYIRFGNTNNAEPSSRFLTYPGEHFYAPVTLHRGSGGKKVFSLQYNVAVTNGLSVTNKVDGSTIDFTSTFVSLSSPDPGNFYPASDPKIGYMRIPALIFTNALNPQPTDPLPPDGVLVDTNNNLNLLMVAWLYRAGFVYLIINFNNDNTIDFDHSVNFNANSSDLIANSIDHDTLFVEGGPTIVSGVYGFTVPTAANIGDRYFIQLGSPSATSDGVGAPGSDVLITPPQTSQAVTVTNSLFYIVGDAAPFDWFNMGDFGNGKLDNADVMQVYQSAILKYNIPPTNSDFFKSMDSSGRFGNWDSVNQYYTDPGTNGNLALTNQQAMWDGNDFSINTNAFGDRTLNINDVYVTFRRSLDPSLVWFKRYWTNGQFVAVPTSNLASNNNTPHLLLTKAASTVTPKAASQTSYQQSSVSFSAGDAIKSAGQTVQIPITANVFGNYPLRVLGLNLTVVPLDGSPAITQAVQFTPAAGLGQPTITASKYAANYNAAWLNSTISGLTGNTTIGTLTVTIPTTATSSSAYAIHFEHVSASPNGLAIFPKQTLTGLITLSSRASSSYGDGIPDSWRLRWFGTANNLLSVSNACLTGDGINNWKKYVAGVDPNVANNFPSVNPKTPVPSGSTTAIHWPTVSGKQYAIERSASLFPGSWTTITTNTGTGTDMEFDDSPAGQTQFYRVRILP
jgi:hypothetical protein